MTPTVHRPPPLVRLRGAVADLRGYAADYRPSPDDLFELAHRLDRVADDLERESRS